MKKVFSLLFIAAQFAFGQALPPSPQSRVAGRFVASNYGQWSLPVYKMPSGTGSKTFTLSNSTANLTDGRIIVPFNINAPIFVGTEKVTPTDVGSGCLANSHVIGGCSITATFTVAHTSADPVRSATYGLQEALNDAGLSGGGAVVIDSAWANLGGTTAIVNAATLPMNTGIEDARTGTLGGGSPGGLSGQYQLNQNGAFAGSALAGYIPNATNPFGAGSQDISCLGISLTDCAAAFSHSAALGDVVFGANLWGGDQFVGAQNTGQGILGTAYDWSRGTIASPTDVQLGDYLYFDDIFGYLSAFNIYSPGVEHQYAVDNGPLDGSGPIPVSETIGIGLTQLILEQTWNSAGSVFNGLEIDITDTASSAESSALHIDHNSTPIFSVSPEGVEANVGGSLAPTFQNTAAVLASALPTCSSTVLLQRAGVTDATVNTPGAALVGSGTWTVPVVCEFHSVGSAYSWVID